MKKCLEVFMIAFCVIGVIHVIYVNAGTPYTTAKAILVCTKLFVYLLLGLFGVIQLFQKA